MKIKKMLFAFAMSAMLFTSCVTVTMVGDAYPERSEDAKIDVYITKEPTQEYTEIAILKCSSIGDESSMESIKTKARKLGADGLIVIGAAETSGVGGSAGHIGVYSSSESGFKVVAIKYVD